MNRFIECTALFVKGYIPAEIFVSFVYDNTDVFEALLDADAYQTILDYSPVEKESKIRMYSEIERYMNEKNADELESIHDAYVELIMDSDRTDFAAKYLRKKNEKVKEIVIDCELASDGEMLRKLVKTKFGLDDTCCGDSWDAIDDLILEEVYPEKVILKNWDMICKTMSVDANALKDVLTKHGYVEEEHNIFLHDESRA
ncbi:hypothetical protein [Butyrivibrio proteoclasticus]|uniref:hypothetical protein n=1 Tax=Butyrivibrio proteoclasticus TaxID=43305 RepID=UPI00047900E1|nr:hypothetical protein [Butyrivibrio proteoclasticus]